MACTPVERSVLHYGDDRIDYVISRSPRLNDKILVHVEPGGDVLVDAPSEAAMETIQKAVRKRARWIARHRHALKVYSEFALPRRYISGESHFYLGRRYVLKVAETKERNVKLWRGRIQVETPQTETSSVRKMLLVWYRNHAESYFIKRLRVMSEMVPWVTGQPPLKLLKMNKQWGSCSPQGRIILNPVLIKAPRECVDYVILHELCHLAEHNHSNRFYELLQKNMPTWKNHKSRLDSMAEMLLNE